MDGDGDLGVLAPWRTLGDRLVPLMDTWGEGVSHNRARRNLATEIDVSPQALTDIEKNRTQPRARTLYALCLALGVSSDYLLGLTADPTPNWDAEDAAARRAVLAIAQRPPEGDRSSRPANVPPDRRRRGAKAPSSR